MNLCCDGVSYLGSFSMFKGCRVGSYYKYNVLVYLRFFKVLVIILIYVIKLLINILIYI